MTEGQTADHALGLPSEARALPGGSSVGGKPDPAEDFYTRQLWVEEALAQVRRAFVQ